MSGPTWTGPDSEAVCVCGGDNPSGFRFDVVCQKHDGTLTIPFQYGGGTLISGTPATVGRVHHVADLIARDRDERIHFADCAWMEDGRPTTWQDIEDVASGQYARCCFPEPMEDPDA